MRAALSARVLTHAQHTLTILRDAFGPRLWCAETGFLSCITRVLPPGTARVGHTDSLRVSVARPQCRGGAPREPGTRACL
jgi:hypothetical protein